ncbi:unnamed protein product [Symbiodinium natans]|uniref:Uncharacterized protein n=1 Tax=Symbiodinium natans TaxID=878477 RepID=A0A812UMS5_9DINO|nr:unnamed protein product [Symbiodinium natans]
MMKASWGLVAVLTGPGATSGYHPDDHSCGWVNQQVLWQRLRRTADDVLAGRTTWTPGQSWVKDIAQDLHACPFGIHVLNLMEFDALGPQAARNLDVGRTRAMGFGLYGLVPLLNFILTGWPSFGFMHRLCLRNFPEQHCLAGSAVLPAELTSLARRQLETNLTDGVGAAAALVQLGHQLEVVKALWDKRWRHSPRADLDETVAMFRFIGLDHERPCCRMWAELQQLQSFVRSHFELPCLSAHRRVDGAVCPACRLSAQAFWFEDREVADRALQRLQEVARPAAESPNCTLHSKEGAFAIATILTSEDLFRSIRVDGQGKEHSGGDDLADAEAIVLSYVDALRTLAHSIRRSAARERHSP